MVIDKQINISATSPNLSKNWLPKDIHHSVKTFIKSVKNKLCHHHSKPYTHSNLKKDEIDLLNKFKNREDIIITKADKGGAVVIMNVDDHLKEDNHHHDNTEFYTILITKPTTTHNDIVPLIINYV